MQSQHVSLLNIPRCVRHTIAGDRINYDIDLVNAQYCSTAQWGVAWDPSFRDTTYYKYGMSSKADRERMLQEVIESSKGLDNWGKGSLRDRAKNLLNAIGNGSEAWSLVVQNVPTWVTDLAKDAARLGKLIEQHDPDVWAKAQKSQRDKERNNVKPGR